MSRCRRHLDMIGIPRVYRPTPSPSSGGIPDSTFSISCNLSTVLFISYYLTSCNHTMASSARREARDASPGRSTSSSPELPNHVLVLYASETGNAQDLAERVARAFRASHRQAVTLSMDAYDVNDLPHESLMIFITSTHGRGDPPPAMRGLWEKLIRKGLPEDILEGESSTCGRMGDGRWQPIPAPWQKPGSADTRCTLYDLRTWRHIVRAILLCGQDACAEIGQPGSQCAQ